MEFEDFFSAFDGGESVPAADPDPVEEPAATEEPAQTESEAGSAEEGTEPTEEPAKDPAEEGTDGSEEQPDGDGGAEEQTFTIQIGEEEHQYSLEEMTELARKGAGYDALQEQLDSANQEKNQIQTQLDSQQDVMDILKQIAEKSGKDLLDLTKQLYINFRKSTGVSEDAAVLELENAQLKKQTNAEKTPAKQENTAEEETRARARRELAEFQQLHPGVKLDDQLVAKLKGDIRKGMSLANAYQKMLNDQKAAALAEQERKNKAAEQNAKNKAASPGSQQDSGGRREKSNYEDFFAQFK